MQKFEVLCVTMNQKDFSKIQEMNINSNIVFANQCDVTSYDEMEFNGHKAKMISTTTRGVGINRNLSLMYSTADICLFADDDVVYNDNYKEIVLKEFEEHPDADIFIFHLETDSEIRKERKYPKTRKCGKFERMPWGAIRVAFRSESVKKANINFTTLFGGGCVFPSGEDSIWLIEARRKGLIFYVSKETIGKVSFEKSSWFTGYDEKFFFGKGVFCEAVHRKTFAFWSIYYALRITKFCELPLAKRIEWINHGKKAYKKMLSYDNYKNLLDDKC